MLVDFNVDSLKTAYSHQILSDQHLEIVLLLLSFGLVPSATDTHPKVC